MSEHLIALAKKYGYDVQDRFEPVGKDEKHFYVLVRLRVVVSEFECWSAESAWNAVPWSEIIAAEKVEGFREGLDAVRAKCEEIKISRPLQLTIGLLLDTLELATLRVQAQLTAAKSQGIDP